MKILWTSGNYFIWLAKETLHKILNLADEKVKNGKFLSIGLDDMDLFENVPAKFSNADKNRIADYFGYRIWFQLVTT